jgi:catechol 2,3-dioxygenase-like lactoylglutathione lyase family enzyme
MHTHAPAHAATESGDWSKTVLACEGSTDLSLRLELVHVRALAHHRVAGDLTELVLASTPTLRRLRQRRPEWEARGWLPLETLSGLVLRIPSSAVALKVVPSTEARAYSGGGGAASSASSEIVAVALPSLNLDAARAFYQEAVGMQVAAGGQVRGGQVALSFGTLGPRLLLVACPPPAPRRRGPTESGYLTPKRTPGNAVSGVDYGDLGCSPPWRAGGGGGEGLVPKDEAWCEEGAEGESVGQRVAGMGVPASTGRLVIGCTTPILHAVSARATVGGHASLVPLSSFPGPRGIRLALTLLQSPDGHEVLAPPSPPSPYSMMIHVRVWPSRWCYPHSAELTCGTARTNRLLLSKRTRCSSCCSTRQPRLSS